jgi:glycosyltransferase involved in cell wall biosynthesis
MKYDSSKVLMIVPTPFFSDRGCHVRILEEARALADTGIDTVIVTYHLGTDPDTLQIERIPIVRWYTRTEAGATWGKIYLDIRLFWQAIRVTWRFRPNIIHAHLHEGALLGIALGYLFKLPVLFDCQGSLTDELAAHGFIRPKSWLERFFLRLERAIYRRVDAIISSGLISSPDNFLTRLCPPSQQRFEFLDWVDTTRFSPARPEQRQARQAELGLPTDRIIGVFLGLLEPYQGIDILLEAFPAVLAENSQIHLLIIGFPHQARYEQKAKTIGIFNRTTFSGRVPYGHIPAYLQAADFAIAPKYSPSEANGKLFNFMAAGLATVAFDTSLNRQILGDAGMYAGYKDGSALAKAIVSLAADPAERTRRGANLRQRAELFFSSQGRGEELRRIYRQVRQNYHGPKDRANAFGKQKQCEGSTIILEGARTCPQGQGPEVRRSAATGGIIVEPGEYAKCVALGPKDKA